MSEHTVPVLSIKQHPPASVVIALDAPRYEPEWNEVKAQVVQLAFAGHPSCFVGSDPPIWDLDLRELSSQVITIPSSAGPFALVFAAAASPELLHQAVDSTDFKLGTLLIAAIPATPAQRSSEFIAALAQRTPLHSAETAEEYMECFDDTWLYWHNAAASAQARCIQMLREFATMQGWQFATDLPGME